MNTFIRRLLVCFWILSFSLFTGSSVGAERVTYYHLDLLGSPVAATDHTGAVVWRESYKPYGQRMLREDGGSNKLWYTGKAHEEGMQLSYYGARWYHPQLGRFLAVDPVDFQEDNVQSFNRYAYANNNPYRYIDPDGRAPWDRNQKGINNLFGLDAGFGPGRGPGGKLDVGAGRVNDNKSFSQIKAEQNQVLSDGLAKQTKTSSKIDRAAFKKEREAFWKAQAKDNPSNYGGEDLTRMQKGKAPKGPDGYPMELHHQDRTMSGGVQPMTRTEHRLGGNYKKNHPD